MADDSSRALERHVHKMIQHTEGPEKADVRRAPGPRRLGGTRA